MFRAHTVILDCDSTLSAIEGIDELATASQRTEIAGLTDAAMRGVVPLEAVYARRLDIVRPGRARIAALGARYVEMLVEDADAVIRVLREEGVAVRLISGGLRPAVLILAEALGVAPYEVRAVDVHFDERGEYSGFETSSPLTRGGGKLTVVKDWTPALRRPILLVGDGATDLEARPAVDRFVAYAGVVSRPDVIAAADEVIASRSLAPLLPIALGDTAPSSPDARELYDRGVRLRSPRPPVSGTPMQS